MATLVLSSTPDNLTRMHVVAEKSTFVAHASLLHETATVL
jgi:hypothetical protein